VVARKQSPTAMRLYACHISSGSVGTNVTSPCPSFSRALRISFILTGVGTIKSLATHTTYDLPVSVARIAKGCGQVRCPIMINTVPHDGTCGGALFDCGCGACEETGGVRLSLSLSAFAVMEFGISG